MIATAYEQNFVRMYVEDAFETLKKRNIYKIKIGKVFGKIQRGRKKMIFNTKTIFEKMKDLRHVDRIAFFYQCDLKMNRVKDNLILLRFGGGRR